MSYAHQLFSPSLRIVQSSGRSRSRVFKTFGVRSMTAMVWWRSCFISVPFSLSTPGRSGLTQSLSRYSSGTSSSGTSWVRTSCSSDSSASSTPATASASSALPSSSSSSTLSESALARLESPCRSPDWPPDRARAVGNAGAPEPLREAFLRAALFGAFFLEAGFFGPVFLLVVFFFAEVDRLRVAFLGDFFFDFFLAAISAVYHRRK